MTTISVAPRPRTRQARSGRRSISPYWLAAVLAIAGAVAGSALAWTTFRDAQRRLDSFDRIPIPGTMSIAIPEPSGRVVYYEGSGDVRFEDLALAVSDPDGRSVPVHRYEGELVYETLDLTRATAVATFDPEIAGVYRVAVAGVDTGHLAIGDSFARRTVPGVLGGLAIVGASLLAAFVLVIATAVGRSPARRDEE